MDEEIAEKLTNLHISHVLSEIRADLTAIKHPFHAMDNRVIALNHKLCTIDDRLSALNLKMAKLVDAVEKIVPPGPQPAG